MIQVDDRWLTDKSLHERLKANPEKELRQLGYAEDLMEGKEFVVVANTKDTCYITIDTLPSSYNDATDLASIQAAGTGCVGISTAACIATVSSMSSLSGTASTFSTGSTAGTVGTDSA